MSTETEQKQAVAYKIRLIDMKQGVNEILLNYEDAEEMGVHPHDRAKLLTAHGEKATAVIDVSDTLVKKGEVGAFVEITGCCNLKDGDEVFIFPSSRPASVDIIKKKIAGVAWSREDIRTMINDITAGNLSDIELTAYAVAIQINGMSMEEVAWLTESMVETGETIEFEKCPVFDVHSVGGVPGNKYAPITVSIVAANGLIIPKTSSRAISSAAGTSDYMDIICNVEHSAKSIKKIAEEVGGTLVWGGGVNLAPADDDIIRVEYPLSLDPHGQVLASVMAKKKAAGINYVVIDIPVGAGAKVKTDDEARRLARDFIDLGERIGIKTRCAITYGGQPVGHAIGPALELMEALSVMEGAEKPNSLIEKSLSLAAIILELGGVAQPGDGRALAEKTLKSGAALKKFREIVAAQGGKADVSSKDLKPGKYTHEFISPKDGYIESLDNQALIKIARAAGAPRSKGAGIMLNVKRGNKTRKGEPLFTVYSENQRKLEDAKSLGFTLQPVKVEGMILEEIVE
ncbi:MAG: AMP phosphorylase [Thermoplasmata archaeon HGW-Thermoplasmata-1]|nr:MAG: AMP phosphorylase [Thermoplasmata archaeon HGW-Thermoplasmata-1]